MPLVKHILSAEQVAQATDTSARERDSDQRLHRLYRLGPMRGRRTGKPRLRQAGGPTPVEIKLGEMGAK